MRAEVGCEQAPQPAGKPVSPCLWWAREFPGSTDQVGQARGWLEELLPKCEPREDLALLVSELCANAVLHTDSGRSGGEFGLTVEWTPEAVKALILDQGSPTMPAIAVRDDAWDDEFGRGLFLVDQLADYWDTADLPDGRLVWLEIPWAAKGGPLLQAPGGYQAAFEDVAVLCGQFPRTTIWWGHRSQSWWAALPGVAGEAGLVHAPTVDALSMVLAGLYPGFCHAPGQQPAMCADSPLPERAPDARQEAVASPLGRGERSGHPGTASRFPGETPSPSPAHH
jgi:anti-sigma regulatory factor (Ser/Thr protein kinase)